MIYLLFWLLIGSLSLNCLWARSQKIYMKKNYSLYEFKIWDYIKGVLIAAIGGPLTIPIKIILDKSFKKAFEKAEKEYEKECNEKRINKITKTVKVTDNYEPKYEIHPDGFKEIL